MSWGADVLMVDHGDMKLYQWDARRLVAELSMSLREVCIVGRTSYLCNVLEGDFPQTGIFRT